MSDLFDQEMRHLLTQSLETLNQRYGVSNKLGDVKKEITYLNQYKVIYEHKDNDPADHHIYFLNLFNSKKNQILKSLNNDSWIKNGNIVIQLGEDKEEFKKKFKDIKIMLSKIYNCAIELQESAMKTSSGLSHNITNQNKDLIRPSIILLHLMRLFYAVCEEDDKPKLLDIITILENDLNVKNKTAKPALAGLGPHLFNNENGSTLQNIFDTATPFLKQLGLDIPDQMQAPSDNQIKGLLQNISENDFFKNTMQTMSESIQKKEDLNTTFATFLNNMLKPENMEGLKSTLMQTAEIARENTQTK